jgi:hypothetical protein
MQTAYVHRPLEFGRDTVRAGRDPRSTLNAADFLGLADRLGL